MEKDNSPEVHFQTFNPYASRFPGLRVVSRETLNLIKYLREEGYRVIVEPDDGTKLNYFVEKGLREILADPVVALIIAIPLDFMINLLSNWVYDVWRRPPQDDEVILVLEYEESGNKLRYSQSGKPISEDRFQRIIKSLDRRFEMYQETQNSVSPDSTRPYPIYYQHTSKLVGWAERFVRDEHGI